MFEHSKSVANEILAERIRQQSSENWTPEHDSQHGNGEIAIAAACYTLAAVGHINTAIDLWPWGPKQFRAGIRDPRDLIKAGALIIAELERLDRLAAAPNPRSDLAGRTE